MKYQKKPVIVEAVQYVGNEKEVVEFCNAEDHIIDAWGNILLTIKNQFITIGLNDWLLKDENGNFFPEEDERFKRDYEPIK